MIALATQSLVRRHRCRPTARWTTVVAAFVCFTAVAAPPAVLAQSATGPSAPQESEIKLPAVLLEIEDIRVEAITAQLPGTAGLEVAGFSVPLPEASELYVPNTAFESLVPTPGTAEGSAGPPADAALFGNGLVGIGTMGHIIGEVSLFKLGDEPRFRFDFAYQGIDGYNTGALVFADPGRGYFATENNLDFWLGYAVDQIAFETEVHYLESKDGLQARGSTFFAVENRFIDGRFVIDASADELVRIGGSVDTALATQLLSVKDESATPRLTEEFVLTPSLYTAITLGPVELGFQGGYDLRLRIGTAPVHVANLGFTVDWTVTRDVVLNGGFAANWTIPNAIAYPFFVGVQGTVADQLMLSLRGGYQVSKNQAVEWWQRMPLLAATASATAVAATDTTATTTTATAGAPWPDTQGWFVRGEARWRASDQFSAELGLEFWARTGVVAPQPFDTTSTAFPLAIEEMLQFRPGLAITVTPSRMFGMRLGWDARLVDRVAIEPAHELRLDLDVSHPDGLFGADLSTTFQVFDQPVVPVVNFGGFVQVSQGIDLLLRVSDVLAPALPGGRLEYGQALGDAGAFSPFVMPGFRVTLMAQIAL